MLASTFKAMAPLLQEAERAMTKSIPIAITMLECNGKYLFLKRRNPPYEGLWSMVGGKISPGEHIEEAAVREVQEETGTSKVLEYQYRGFVTERLIERDGILSAHFLIFVGHAIISDFEPSHREGDLSLFSLEEVESMREQFLPSDYKMFHSFLRPQTVIPMYEAELLRDDKGYHLVYYREPSNEVG
jgi:8-oxo-dGTP pyrophosphatase MutT (NUDIX family)